MYGNSTKMSSDSLVQRHMSLKRGVIPGGVILGEGGWRRRELAPCKYDLTLQIEGLKTLADVGGRARSQRGDVKMRRP